MEIYGKTDRGRVRSANQDSYLFGDLPGGGGYAVVCDGMGGYNAGNVAGEIGVRVAAETIARGYGDCADARHLLASSLEAANDAILSSAESNPSYSGMGATVVAVLVEYDAADANGGAVDSGGDITGANGGAAGSNGGIAGADFGAAGSGDKITGADRGAASPNDGAATLTDNTASLNGNGANAGSIAGANGDAAGSGGGITGADFGAAGSSGVTSPNGNTAGADRDAAGSTGVTGTGGATDPGGVTADASTGAANADCGAASPTGYMVGTTGAGGPGNIPFGYSSPPVATATIAHMGDSRAYLFSGGRLTAVTRDHSLVQSMVDNGQLTESEAMRHPRKNMVTRALGAEATAEGDYDEVALYEGDIILLCTDGLTNFVERDDIARILSGTPVPDAPAALVDAANNAGGGDNVTAVLLKVIPPGGPVSDAGKTARETVR